MVYDRSIKNVWKKKRTIDGQIKIAKSGNYCCREYMQIRECMDAQFSAGKKEGNK